MFPVNCEGVLREETVLVVPACSKGVNLGWTCGGEACASPTG